MSLTRPAWSVTIAAPGHWSYTITQGDDPFGGDLEFVPPLVAGVAFDGDQLPAPIAPVSLQFRLLVRHTAALPSPLIEGQLLTFTLERPTEDHSAPYVQSVMRISDLEATIDRRARVWVDVTAVDVLATFRGRRIDASLPRQTLAERLERVAREAGFAILHDLPSDPGVLAPLELEQQSAGDTAQTALNVDPWMVLVPAGPDTPTALRVVQLDPEARFEHALLEFVRERGRVELRDRDDLPATDKYGVVLNADWIDLSPTWRRGKESRPNKAIANGVEDPAHPQPSTAAAEHKPLVTAYGESALTVDTHLYETARLEQTARRALPQRADLTSAWAVDSLTLVPERMDDDQLDHLAPMFVPHADGSGSAAPPATVAVRGVPEDLSLGRIAGRVTRVDFTIDGGDLTIVPRLLPAVPRSPETPSYAQWRADAAFAAATYSADDVDPAITYAEAKLARLPGGDVPPDPEPEWVLQVTRTWVFNAYDGLFDWLGTARATAPFANPVPAHVTASALNQLIPETPPRLATDHSAEDGFAYCSTNTPGSWIAWDFGPGITVRPARFGIQHALAWDGDYVRNFKLQGSQDGVAWTDLRDVVNEGPTLGAKFWSTDVVGAAAYRHLRIILTGPGAHGNHYLAAAEVEFWGDLYQLIYPD